MLDFRREAPRRNDPKFVTPLLGPPKDERSLREEAEECFAKGCELDTDPETCDEAVECYLQGARVGARLR